MRNKNDTISVLIIVFYWFLFGGVCCAIAKFNGMLIGGIIFLASWIVLEIYRNSKLLKGGIKNE